VGSSSRKTKEWVNVELGAAEFSFLDEDSSSGSGAGNSQGCLMDRDI